MNINLNMNAIFVKKRDGSSQEVSFDKVLRRIKSLSPNLDVNPHLIGQKVCNQIYNGVSTSELDILAGEICANMITTHPDYEILAARITMSNLEKNTSPSFSETIDILYNNKDIHGNNCSLISDELYKVVQTHKTKINSVIKNKRDSNIGYFGLKTLEKSYLFKINGIIVERPQYMFMRVSLGIHGENIKEAIKTYDAMSEKYFIHATPTLFNAGTKRPQLSSCFLLSMKDDSIEGIYSTLKNCALISKWAGGIGLHSHNVRAKNSLIRGTNGISNGLVPMLRVFNNTARYVDQCVYPETIIYTTQGPIKMEDVSPGETNIFNNAGHIETVENVLEHSYDGDIISIKTEHCINNLNITPEHPILILKNQEITDYELLTEKLNRNLISPTWVDAKNLRNNDMFVYSIPNYEKDIHSLNEYDCYIYGLILQNGYLNNKLQRGTILLNEKQEITIKKFKEYLDSKLIKFSTKNIGQKIEINWDRNVNFPFKYSDFYKNNKKNCHYRLLNLPIEKIKNIIKGLLEGCNEINKYILFNSTSDNIANTLKYLCLRIGVLIGGGSYDKVSDIENLNNKNEVISQDIFNLKIPITFTISQILKIKPQCDDPFFRYKNLLFSKIIDIEQSKYSGVLYDLQMKNKHNYMIQQGIVHNGGGKRNGSIAIYLEPWHSDIISFLDLRKNHGNEEERARDLFYALWICDLFMKRVKDNGDWTLMCPDECPGLSDHYGEEFENLYQKYEMEGRGKKTIKAQELWKHILESQIETGTPYLLYKDACNKKSNQKNLGTIKSSNLCCEIVEYSDKDESAVCNLASIGLPKYIILGEDGKNIFDYQKLGDMTKQIVKNLNRVIDINFYPIQETKKSNLRHRPIGIGVQGLADVFAMLNISFDSKEAKKINIKIFETIYYYAMETSMDLSRKREKQMKKYKELLSNITDENKDELEKLKEYLLPIEEEINRNKFLGSYSSFEGSPLSQGILQFDMWGVSPSEELKPKWDKLVKDIKKYGTRNSLLLAPMPTASTSQILGNNECFEPYTSNLYIRRTLAGEFIVINEHLVRDLIKIGKWNQEIKDKIIFNEGSIQEINEIPEKIKNIYKTVWEISQKVLIDMSADRGAFICQSQSLNLFIADPDFAKLSSMHFYSWNKGLKTGIYYLRTKPVAKAQQFTIDPTMKKELPIKACNRNDPDCVACGS